MSEKDAFLIFQKWEQFVLNGDSAGLDVDPVISRSWQRCKKAGVDFERGQDEVLGASEFRLRRAQLEHLINIAIPFMQKLYHFVAGSGFAVVLTDHEGYIMEIIGDKDFIHESKERDFQVGANWSEFSKGTNAMGTAIIEKKPVQVYATEHYCRPNHSLTCSGAPIFSPDGELLGVLDVTGHYFRTHPHTLGMVVAAAQAIENHMRLEMAYKRATTIMESMSEGLISLDRYGVITQMNSVAGKMLGVSPEDCLGEKIEVILGEPKVVRELLRNGNDSQSDQEMVLDCRHGRVHVVATARPIKHDTGRTLGVVVTMREIKTVHRLVNQMVGAQACFTFDDIIGNSPGLREVVDLAKQVASSDSTILLQGESGTGKEMFAQAIHSHSNRNNGPFVAINCAAIPRDLVESELFGYEEGAFTGAKRGGRPGKFELANGGTIFLDEIGDMPLETQVKLLRVLQQKQIIRVGGQKAIPIDIRVIAATNKDLGQEVERGNFREDLYYRLNVIPINIPPLRERGEDLVILASHMVEKLSRQLGKRLTGIAPEAMECLKKYPWPGNVRELENVLERAVNIAAGTSILRQHLPEKIQRASNLISYPPKTGLSLREWEKEIIIHALKVSGGNIAQTARILNVGRTTLYRKIKEYNLDVAALASLSN